MAVAAAAAAMGAVNGSSKAQMDNMLFQQQM